MDQAAARWCSSPVPKCRKKRKRRRGKGLPMPEVQVRPRRTPSEASLDALRHAGHADDRTMPGARTEKSWSRVIGRGDESNRRPRHWTRPETKRVWQLLSCQNTSAGQHGRTRTGRVRTAPSDTQTSRTRHWTRPRAPESLLSDRASSRPRRRATELQGGGLCALAHSPKSQNAKRKEEKRERGAHLRAQDPSQRDPNALRGRRS